MQDSQPTKSTKPLVSAVVFEDLQHRFVRVYLTPQDVLLDKNISYQQLKHYVIKGKPARDGYYRHATSAEVQAWEAAITKIDNIQEAKIQEEIEQKEKLFEGYEVPVEILKAPAPKANGQTLPVTENDAQGDDAALSTFEKLLKNAPKNFSDPDDLL